MIYLMRIIVKIKEFYMSDKNENLRKNAKKNDNNWATTDITTVPDVLPYILSNFLINIFSLLSYSFKT